MEVVETVPEALVCRIPPESAASVSEPLSVVSFVTVSAARVEVAAVRVPVSDPLPETVKRSVVTESESLSERPSVELSMELRVPVTCASNCSRVTNWEVSMPPPRSMVSRTMVVGLVVYSLVT